MANRAFFYRPLTLQHFGLRRCARKKDVILNSRANARRGIRKALAYLSAADSVSTVPGRIPA